MARSFLFGAIRMAWFADADTEEELVARVIAFQRSSLVSELGLIHKARANGAEPDIADSVENDLVLQLAEVDGWKNKTSTARRSVDEVKLAVDLGLQDFIAVIAVLDQHVHLNRSAINAMVAPDRDEEGRYVIGSQGQPELAKVILNACLTALGVALLSFLKIIEADAAILAKAKELRDSWRAEVVADAERAVESARERQSS